ncbi:hypothetical protein [Alicyclobacillus macrosporangiidus]|uniref:Uncharacterized protein n=1 Tax=Alicyclobacillus macrosporangiidus TaxID=392015 RepID=A0A1I7HQX6_9BACL|nr:hypothetical protein [Alicyclobacillus macrosporangiidus]SFU63049.1 hypothetical protein SAMN05421543_10547 [Alicyclobacillus macrosporangiidus]
MLRITSDPGVRGVTVPPVTVESTFGTIASLYGLNHPIITEAQDTALVTVAILSALIPTFIAQTFFFPGKPASESPDQAAVPAVSPGTPDAGP